MKVALTGASGIVGGFVAPALAAAGHAVDPLPGWRLGAVPDLRGADALVHLALAHLPGRYRGGEGDDPEGFRRANLGGTLRLFEAAAAAGVRRVVFLSSRAVHDGHPPGRLADDLPPRPATLYGEVKAEAEAALDDLPLIGVSLRATGVYGAGRANKWAGLFRDFLRGDRIAPQVATEVHGDDLAAAVLLALIAPAPARRLNVGDLVLDRADLLTAVAALTGCRHLPPPRADAAGLRIPDCTGLRGLGWRPGGIARLRETLPALLPG